MPHEGVANVEGGRVFTQRRRRCALQRRVATMRLPWATVRGNRSNPKGVAAFFACANRMESTLGNGRAAVESRRGAVG